MALSLQKYQQAVSELEGRFATLRGTGTYVYKSVSGGNEKTVRSFSFEFSRKPQMYRNVVTNYFRVTGRGREPLPDQVTCINPSRSFRLQRASGTKSFSLKSVGEPNEQPLTTSFVILTKFLNCICGFDGRPLARELAKPSFSLNKVENVVYRNRPMMKFYFHYENKRPLGKKRSFPMNDVQIIVSPEDRWATHYFEADRLIYPEGSLSPLVTAGTVEYGENHEGVPVPERIAIRNFIRLKDGEKERLIPEEGRTIHEGETIGIETCEFKGIEFSADPDDAFSLAAFGLPEIGKSGFHRPGGYLSRRFFVAAVALLLAAVSLKIYARRHRTAHASTTSPSVPSSSDAP